MTPYTPQDIQTFGAGIIAITIVFGAFVYAILKLAPILGKINTQLEIGNKKEDSTNKLVVAVDALTEWVKSLKKDGKVDTAIIEKNRKTKTRTQLSQVDKDQLLFALAELHGLLLPEIKK